ncbi:39864_t:CDS:2 [Gigaspora margarita]|uniref:39864_t:CDS:1 n=1 Tax=Gigaspora margarita TaxID=4874 RepID=A0ABN7VB83_GIGMA|nr:39864_t:CDS:2 [Gigaspora margarita]
MASKFCGIAEEISNYYQTNYTNTTFEEYTLISLFPYKSLRGKTMLDLSCITGWSSRLAVKLGAESVIGVGISPKMVDIAKKFEEETGGSKIKYIVRDIVDIDKLGEFDVVWVIYLLLHAKDIDNLKKRIQVAYNNLKLVSTLNVFEETGFVNVKFQKIQVELEEYAKNGKNIGDIY